MLQAPTPIAAQDYQSLFRDFDARGLTASDKRFLQAALAFQGHYNGLLDGAWGKISQRALDRYSRREFGTAAENWHMAMLAWSLFEIQERDGWSMRFFPSMGLSVLWPEKTIIQDSTSESFLNFHHSASSFSISLGILSKGATENVHQYTLNTHEIGSKPYTVRKPRFAVSAAENRDGSTLYARSNFVNGAWSTILLSANKADNPYLGAVAASISEGRAAPLQITYGGVLDEAIQKALTFAEEENRNSDTVVSSQPDGSTPSNTDSRSSSGSGMIVSVEGHVLTNAHVVDGCNNLFVDGEKAEMVAASEDFDLALLKSDMRSDKSVAVFSASSAKLNSDVTAIGFPYAGLLGGLNVTRGSVSSLKGLGGNATTMQITSPIQAGNSGGPLLSADGEVVGVVVSKLNVKKIADLTGDMPQNVNFAIRGEIAKLFLAQNGIDPLLSLTDDRLAPEDLATKARAFTTFIECR